MWLTNQPQNPCNDRLFQARYRSKPNETHLSAVQDPPSAHARLSRTHENPWRTRRHQSPSSQGSRTSGGVNGARAKLPRLARLSGAVHFTGEFSARRQGVYFTILFRNMRENRPARLGIVAGRHAVPSSVDRSFMKRAIREVFRNKRGGIGSLDVIVRVRRPADRRNIAEARHELEKLLSQSR